MIILTIIVLFSYIKAGAQEMPDYVYVGVTKHYNVDPTLGSTYTWWIDVAEQSEKTNGIDIIWTIPGKFILTVQEYSAGCEGPVQKGEVYVYQITPPRDLIECVENISIAYYNAVTKKIIIGNSDYYIFKPGDTRLDLSPSNFADIFSSSCAAEIHWQINFAPTPDPITHHSVTKASVTGIGQPSKIIENILFPGDGVNFRNVVHTITYQVVDCHGNIFYTNTQMIMIKPRPRIE